MVIGLELDEEDVKRLKYLLEDEIDFLMSINEVVYHEVYLLNKLYSKSSDIINKRCESRVRKAFEKLGIKI